MDCTLHASPFAAAGTCRRIESTLEFNDIALGILYDFIALYDIGIFEADLAVRFETEELLGSILHEVRAADGQFSGERHLT